MDGGGETKRGSVVVEGGWTARATSTSTIAESARGLRELE